MRLKNTPSQATQTPTVSSLTTAPAPVVATVQKSTPVARVHRKRWSVGRVALWGIGLVPLVMLGLMIKPRIETRLHQERVASRKEPLAFLPVSPGFVANGMSFASGERYLAIRSYKEKPSFQGSDVIWTNQTTLVDRMSGKPLSVTQNPPTGLSWAIALSENGRTFVTKEYGDFKKKQGLLIWWDSATGKAIRRVTVPGYEQEVLFSQGARELLLAQDGQLELIDPQTGRRLSVLPLPRQIGKEQVGVRAHQLALSPNGQWIAGRVPLQKVMGRYDEAGAGIVLWKRGEKASRWAFPVREHGSSNTISVADDGTVLATVEKVETDSVMGYDDNKSRGVICLDAVTGQERWFVPQGQTKNRLASALAIDPARDRVALRYWDRQIELRRLTDGRLITEIDTGQKVSNSGASSERVRFSDDGKTLYDRQVGGIALWSLEGLK